MLQLEFMRLALAVGVVVGILAPAVGFFLVERRQALVGDGLGHVAFAGVAAGYLIGVEPVLTALVFAVVGGLAIEWLRTRGGAAGDQALALVFYTGIALGLGSLAAIAALYRGLVGAVLDEEGSRVAGVRVGLLNTTVAVLAALTIGISMRVVGILLIAALMALPVLAAQRVAWSLRSTLGLAMAIGVVSVVAGLVLSYYGDLAPGGTIVLIAAGAFVVAALVGARPLLR